MAAGFLIKNGYRIVCKNYYLRSGEIDIIAYDKDGTLVFVEVKYRSSAAFGDPKLAVNAAKIKKIEQTAKHYMLVNKIMPDTPCRIDVIAITGDYIEHLKNVTGY